jgi:TP901 family phage tail tape measure protein
MSASASGIKAGKAYIEVSGDDSELRKTLAGSAAAMKAFGKGIGSVAVGIKTPFDLIGGAVRGIGESLTQIGGAAKDLGTKIAGVGLAGAAGLGAGVRAFASYEDAMASLRANAKPTAKELEQITAAIQSISTDTGVGPAKVTAAMTELIKAGLPLKDVLGGATAAAIQFAKVAEMDVAEAATTLTDAMNVFGVDAKTAVDTLSRAADASSISVQDVSQSFAMASAVAKQAGLSIQDTANAIAILGQNGVKGSDAGTSLKTMLLRLLAPADEGAKTIKALGIHVREADGSMKPMAGIIAELQSKLAGLNQEAKDEAMKDIFGSDAIRAGAILIGKGVAGWDDFNKKMGEGLPISEKFAVLMDTLSGFVQRGQAALERLGVEVGRVLAPALREATTMFTDFIDGVTTTIKANPQLVTQFATLVKGAIATGAALVAVGTALSTVGSAISFVATPVGALTAAVGTGGAAWLAYTEGGRRAIATFLPTITSMKDTAVQAFAGITAALKGGDLAGATKIAMAGLQVAWLKGVDFLMTTWGDLKTSAKEAFTAIGFTLDRVIVNAMAGVKGEWATLMTGMTGSFAAMVHECAALLVRMLSPFAGVAKKLGVDVADQGLNLVGINETEDEKRDRQKKLTQEQGRIEQERQGKIAEVDKRQAKHNDTFAAKQAMPSVDPEAKRRREELAAAQAELDTLTGNAQASAPAAAAADPWATPEADRLPMPKKKAPAVEPEAIEKGLGAAARKVDVKGTFNAAALRGLGAGDSVNSILEDSRKTEEKMLRQLEKLNDKAKDGQLVFGM